MKKLTSIWGVLLLALTLSGCSDNPTSSSDVEASAEKQFVWNAMNYWYYWQGDVPKLADDHFGNNQELQEYLVNLPDAEAVLNDLLHNDDDFSFFIEDYEEFQQSQQGISESFGYEFGLVRISESSNNIFGYVQYVMKDPESPAEQAGLVRGDIFTEVDGIQLTVNNYQDLLLGTTNYQLGMAAIQEDGTIEETGETIDLQAVTLQEDPVFISKVLQEDNTKIGYLMYNAFQTNYHEKLNDVFGTFQSEGIDELVIDLRYNGGGAGITTQMLAGMISGLDDSKKFATYSYNEERSIRWNRTVNFLNEVPIYENGEQSGQSLQMNNLNMADVYMLVDQGTASASELLINALKPYINVTLVGQQTIGKDEGSYTLYDTFPPYLEKEDANPDHMHAIQPIVLKLVNKNGEAYPDGFSPNHEVNELASLFQDGELPPLGDKSDPLLAKAIELITGQPPAKFTQSKNLPFVGEMIKDSRDLRSYGKRLYLQPPSQLPNQ